MPDARRRQAKTEGTTDIWTRIRHGTATFINDAKNAYNRVNRGPRPTPSPTPRRKPKDPWGKN